MALFLNFLPLCVLPPAIVFSDSVLFKCLRVLRVWFWFFLFFKCCVCFGVSTSRTSNVPARKVLGMDRKTFGQSDGGSFDSKHYLLSHAHNCELAMWKGHFAFGKVYHDTRPATNLLHKGVELQHILWFSYPFPLLSCLMCGTNFPISLNIVGTVMSYHENYDLLWHLNIFILLVSHHFRWSPSLLLLFLLLYLYT